MAKILVIDDERRVLVFLHALLSRMGHEPVLAPDGDEGCKLLEHDPDIRMVFTDFCMPGKLRETDLIRRLLELRPGIPVVVISGYPDAQALEECNALGVRDYLAKPFELSFVSSVVKKVLGE